MPISDELTLLHFGYSATQLASGSEKKVYSVCDEEGCSTVFTRRRTDIKDTQKTFCRPCVDKRTGKNRRHTALAIPPDSLLTPIKYVRSAKYGSIWKFECTCGAVIEKNANNVVSGNTKSCGDYLKHPDRHGIIENRDVRAINEIMRQYKHRDKKRGYIFGLSFDTFSILIKQNCHYCGCPPSCRQKIKTVNAGNTEFLYSTLDRKDSSLGYSESNVVPACMTCQVAKNDRTPEEFFAWLRRLNAHQAKISQSSNAASVIDEHF